MGQMGIAGRNCTIRMTFEVADRIEFVGRAARVNGDLIVASLLMWYPRGLSPRLSRVDLLNLVISCELSFLVLSMYTLIILRAKYILRIRNYNY